MPGFWPKLIAIILLAALHAVAEATNSHAMGLWKPNPKFDTCSQELHDSYSVIGPDGRRYPTWHPPEVTNPATGKKCSFGHEHGRDPRKSALWTKIRQHFAFDANGDGKINSAELASAGLPFGYVNEQLDVFNSAKGINNGMRHEDHVGHKIEWENDLMLQRNSCGTVSSPGCWERTDVGVRCDFLMKPHQGTHSGDALVNNMHELIYAVSCRDAGATGDARNLIGTQLIASTMTVFGRPGGFNIGGVAGNQFQTVGQCTPANSPVGGGMRIIPSYSQVMSSILVSEGQFSNFSVLYEDWLSANYLRDASGQQLAYYDPHFAVFLPSRFFAPDGIDYSGLPRTLEDRIGQVGRSADLCHMVTSDGRRARGGPCAIQTNYGEIKEPIAWDDPRSQFNGVRREFYFNQTVVTNVRGATRWYSDPFGKSAVPESVWRSNRSKYVGFVPQAIARVDNRTHWPLESQALGKNRTYGHPTVHAPN